MAADPAGQGFPGLSKKDFVTDQEVRWCPGCGDYAILNAVQSTFPELGIPRENFVVVSGIGCASRFPYYVNAFGFHGIHGRAPAIASGLKIMRPELQVWVVGGDGDLLSIGGNHLIHVLRRNVGLKILLHNNRIYGLTKGQYSPTSEVGKKTKSTPFGSVDRPFNTVSLALGADATFVARSVDIFGPHLKETLRQAASHEGTAFIEVYQNCNIFNDGAFDFMREKEVRDDGTLVLKHGQPMIFGKSHDKGIRLVDGVPKVVHLGRDGIGEADLWVHDVAAPIEVAFALSRMGPPDFPTPIGVFRAVEVPTYESALDAQITEATARKGPGDLARLLGIGDAWVVL